MKRWQQLTRQLGRCHVNTQCSMMPSPVTTLTVHCARPVCSMIVSSTQNSVKRLQYLDTRMSKGTAEFSLKDTFRFLLGDFFSLKKNALSKGKKTVIMLHFMLEDWCFFREATNKFHHGGCRSG